jgi:hypothetical protein
VLSEHSRCSGLPTPHPTCQSQNHRQMTIEITGP